MEYSDKEKAVVPKNEESEDSLLDSVMSYSYMCSESVSTDAPSVVGSVRDDPILQHACLR